MKVFVYYNLHRKIFSVRALEGPDKGRVVAHRSEVSLTDVVFRVSEAGRQRVLIERCKNVHAGVSGQWTDVVEPLQGQAVTYNPYLYSSFVNRETLEPVLTASQAFLKDRTITAVI
jgi:hypothetical protein